ncbi:TadE/TadG family type IV pilus assembly protein [Moorella sp. E308F]|uniref:TadE/TadG family type IV pilus assembly protein n=1 Tax=Moorella sp. E308F TaxID=2572682 RepID=UPI0027D971A0|nr:TadE/TadG family type IV pilus assembly protein [Moorella sp. E308F]
MTRLRKRFLHLSGFLRHSRASSPVVTAVILLPLLMAVAWGFAWFGHMADAKNVVEEAARSGARWLASHPGDIEGAKSRAADVVLAALNQGKSFIPGGAISQDSLNNVLVGRLIKTGNGYVINDRTRGPVKVKPASPGVKSQMDALAGKVVVADGDWAEANVFLAKVATTDPPETQAMQQVGGISGSQSGTQGSQTVNQTRRPGPFPAAVLAKYGQGIWGTGWAQGWPDPNAWWIWGQPGAGECALNGQEVTLTSPVWWTAGYDKYRLYAVADDWFNVRVDSTDVLQGSGQGVKTWDWEPGPRRPVQFVVTARNDYGPTGFLCTVKQTGWHWPVSYPPQSLSNGLVKYPEWTVPYAQWVTVTAKDRYGRAAPVYVGTGNAGSPQNISTSNALRLQVSSHRADVWSNPWSPPGGRKIKRIYVKGKSERNYDYGYVYGWNGSSWVLLAQRCSPGYNQEYDEWIDVSSYNVTRIKTRLTTDRSVLYSPTYVDVPVVETEASGWVATGNGTVQFYAYPNTKYFVCVGTGNGDTQSTGGALRVQVSSHRADVWSNPWSPPGGGKIKRIHVKGKSERNYDYGYVYGWNGSSWVLLAQRCSPGYNQEYDEWIDVSSYNVTRIKTRLTTDRSVLYSPTYVDVPVVEVEAQSGQGYDVTVNLDGGVVLHSDSSWTYTPVDGVAYGAATLPQRVVPGGEFTVKISATNLARKEWFASRPSWWPGNWNSPDSWRTNFSYHWYDDKGNLVVQDGLRTGLPQTVQPGGSANLDLKVKAPPQPGKYRLVVDGVQEYCAWFGPLQGVNWPTLEAWIDVGGIDYAVSYNPAWAPKYMEAGKTYNLQITARNDGGLTWTPQGRFGLSYHWYDKNTGRVVVWDGSRDYVDYAVAPGQSYTFNLPVKAPSKPGTYTLEIDMVQEGVTWFKDKGCPVLRADVEVPQGDVLKGPLTFDGEDYWVGNTIVRSAGPDLSRFAGMNAVLWGQNTGQVERFFRVKSIQEYAPDDWSALVTFDPDKDVLCNDPNRGDPQAQAGDPVSKPRTDNFAYCRVTYHYPVPLQGLWKMLSHTGVPAWRGEEPPSRRVVGEAYFVSGEAGK